MKELKIPTFYLCVFLYLVINIIFSIFAIVNNEIIVELQKYIVANDVILASLFLQFFSLFYFFLLYILFRRRKFYFSESVGYNKIAALLLLSYQFLGGLLAFKYGLNVVGNTDINVPYIIWVIFTMISPDILFFIVGSQLKSNKLFKLNLIFYLVSSLIRGWMGGFLIAFFIYVSRKGGLKVSLRSTFILLSLLIGLLALTPFLVDLKFSIRSGKVFVIDFTDYSARLALALDYLFSRFQFVGYLALIAEKQELYIQYYNSNHILPFYKEGLPQFILMRLLGEPIPATYGEFVAKNQYGGTGWAIGTGLAGWFYILKESSLFLMIYFSILVTSLYYFILKYSTRQLFEVASVLTIVFLFHGWFFSFINFYFMCLILIFLKKLKLN